MSLLLVVEFLIVHDGDVGVDDVEPKLVVAIQLQVAPEIVGHVQAVVGKDVIIGFQVVKQVEIADERLPNLLYKGVSLFARNGKIYTYF